MCEERKSTYHLMDAWERYEESEKYREELKRKREEYFRDKGLEKP